MDLKRTTFLLLFSFTVSFVFAQDSLQLTCPLKSGVPKVIRASDKDYQKSSEYGVMITSKTDTLVQAVHDGAVIIVARTEEMRYDLVIQFKNYFFWYAGILMPKVRQGVRIKAGDIIGTYKPGDLLEILMYQQEEPVNPRKYLKCN
ncbi:MAG TPA: M23 family metallopeptidase [Chitinophagaceae bacterium]|nr:M23 family metallopeptidase [Chitinophagaceae bacterium]